VKRESLGEAEHFLAPRYRDNRRTSRRKGAYHSPGSKRPSLFAVDVEDHGRSHAAVVFVVKSPARGDYL